MAMRAWHPAEVVIHLDAPNGPLSLAARAVVSPVKLTVGLATTPSFHLQNVSAGLPLTAMNTIAMVELKPG